MDSLTIRQKDNTQVAILHLRDLHPTTDAAISLDNFPTGRSDGFLDPFVSNDSPIWALTDCFKVTCNFHPANVAEIRDPGSSCRITLVVRRAEGSAQR